MASTGQVKAGGCSDGKPDHIIRVHYYVNLKEKSDLVMLSIGPSGY